MVAVSLNSVMSDVCPYCRRPRREGHSFACPKWTSDPATPAAAPPAVLSTDSKERKATPIFSGVLAYFPRAIAYIAKVSKAGNDKHNPGLPLQWSKDKSNDHADCAARHLIESGTVDPEDNLRHSGKLAWRALALLETELENEDKEAA